MMFTLTDFACLFRRPLSRLLLLGCLAVLLLPACQTAPQRHDDPIAVMLDRDAYPDARQSAAAQAEDELPADPARLEALERLITEPGHGRRWQMYAATELADADESRARDFLAGQLPAISSWDTAGHVLDLAVERGWRDLLPAIVRRYAVPSRRYSDAERPERAAIAQLAPDRPPRQVVRDVFTGEAPGNPDVRERAAAFALLGRLIDDRDALRQMLLEIEPDEDDTLIADLQAGARELHVLPNNLETLTWLRLLRTGALGSLWPQAAAVIAELDEPQRRGLAMRHLPVLVYVAENEPSLLSRSFSDLYSELDRHLSSVERHELGSTVDSLADHPQQLAAWRDQLVWADLVTIHTFVKLLADGDTVERLFIQADADLKEADTELGGLIVPDADRARPRLYEPDVRRHAKAYYPPPELIFDGYTALAHYHFHAQREQNRRYAGPGDGDLQRIGGRQQFNGLVLTFIDRNRLNVDYYQAGRVVVDLGTVYR